MFYSLDSVCTVIGGNFTGANRYGIGWNAVTNHMLSITGAKTSGNTRGIAIMTDGAMVSDCVMEDQLFINGVYLPDVVGISNVRIQNFTSTTQPCVYFYGNVKNINFNNLIIDNCTVPYFIQTNPYFGDDTAYAV